MKYNYNYDQFRDNSRMTVKRGDVYFANFSGIDGYGSELRGTRPVLIVQNDVGNAHSQTVIVAPLTSQMNKANLPTHLKITCFHNGKPSLVFLEHLITIDKDRLYPTLKYELNEEELKELDKKLLISLGINL